MRKKTKISIILAIILLVVGAILAYYFLAGGGKNIIEEPEQEDEVQVITTPKTKSKLTQLTNEYVVSPVLNNEETKIRYITKGGGDLFEMDISGKNTTQIPFISLQNLIKIIWSPDQSSLINIYTDAFGVKRFFYDLDEKKTTPLNRNITWLDYSKTEDKIAYHYNDSSQNINSIAISNPDGSNSISILNTRLKDVRLNWINEDRIAISTAPSGLAQNILYYIDPKKPKLIKILSNIYGLTYNWSPDGSRILFSETDKNGNNLRLSLSNGSGSEQKPLRIQTLPEKCVFSIDNNSAFCAEPKDIPKSAILPDDYYKKLFVVNDILWKIDLETGKRSLLYDFKEDVDIDMSEMILTKDEKFIIFVNRANGFLYKLEL